MNPYVNTQSEPMGTDGQMDKRTNKRTNRRTDKYLLIYSGISSHPLRGVRINTLLLYIPLLALTHGQNYRQRNEYTRCAWAGGTFFSVVLSHHFLVLAGNRFWFTYLCTQSTIQLWCCVSFCASGMK